MPDPRPTSDHHESEPTMSTTSAHVLPATPKAGWWRWIALGLLAAVIAWVALVVLASMEASSEPNGSATAGALGIDMVTVTRTRSADGSSAGLTTERGALALLALPLAGAAVALVRRTSRERPAAQD